MFKQVWFEIVQEPLAFDCYKICIVNRSILH